MRIEAALPEIFRRHRTLVFVLAALTTLAVAAPPSTIFGSHDLERLKDAVAVMLALGGLAFRAAAIGAAPREMPVRPPCTANWMIAVGLFLMHGHPLVFAVGLAACLAVQQLLLRDKGEVVCETRLRLGAGFLARARSGLARDWQTAALTVALLFVTEFYEEQHVAGGTSLRLVFLASSAAALATAFVVALRAGRTAATAPVPDGPHTEGIRVDGRVGSVDVLENLISLGRLSAILDATLDAAALRPGERIVDVGCGSGRLAIEAASRFQNGAAVDVLGIDATPGMIDLARANAGKAGFPVRFEVGVGESLPLADASVDAVTSSYFFHHLPSHAKRQALREMVRVLAPGGRLVITDYGRPAGMLGQIAALPMRFNFYEHVRGQLAGELETIIAEEGLGPPERLRSFLGYVNVTRLMKPETVAAFDATAPSAITADAAVKLRRKRRLGLSRETADALLIPWARMFLWSATAVLQLRPPYHSIDVAGGRSGKRETETRWTAIASVIETTGAQSILDFGCAEGWFLRRAAEEFDCIALGVDSYESRVMLGEAARLHAGVDRVAIMKGKLAPDDIRKLPACDVVLCLSVLHWVIRQNGLAFAQDLIRALAGRANKALIFEVGEAETLAGKFPELVPPTSSGEDFVRALLASSGVANVRVIASSPDIHNQRRRLLFVGEPVKAGATTDAPSRMTALAPRLH